MSAPTGSLVVIGSGPGIGSHVAALFASKSFAKVALTARNPEQLAQDKVKVEGAARGPVDVRTYVIDVTDGPKLSATLKQIGNDLGTPECVFFNAARVQESKLLETTDEEMMYDFHIQCASLHTVAKWAIPQLTQLAKDNTEAKPSVLVTSSHLPQEPEPPVFVLSLAKAAQRNMTQSLAKVYGPLGVHIGVLVVAGPVAPSNEQLNPTNIAERAWDWFSQDKAAQTFEMAIREN